MKAMSLLILVTMMWSISQAQERPPHRMNLTDDQKVCLESKIGKPGAGERASREAMQAAFDECGIKRPERPDQSRFRDSSREQSGYATSKTVSSSRGAK